MNESVTHVKTSTENQWPRRLEPPLRKTYGKFWASIKQWRNWHAELAGDREGGEAPVGQRIRLRDCEERLRLAQDAADLGIYEVDMCSGAVRMDRRVREIWGVGSDQPGTYAMLVSGVHPEDRANLTDILAARHDPGNDRRYRAEYRVVGHGNGCPRTVKSTGMLIFEAGRPVRFIVTVQDVTESRRLEKEFRGRRDEVYALHKQQVTAQTAAAIAHELNQPLVAISAYGEAALRGLRGSATNPDKLRHALEGCINQAQRAGRTLNELLVYLHRGKVEVEVIDIDALICETITTIRADGFDELRMVLKIEPGLRPLLGNWLQVKKVLHNLLLNGAEAMREAGTQPASISITMNNWAERNMVLVTVRDSGPGLDADKARRIFRPFYTTKPNGIGLGLPISRALVEAQGGRLWIAPDGGPGATFFFTLPFAYE